MALWKNALLALLLSTGIGALAGCGAADSEDVEADEGQLQAGGPHGPALFRNDFFTYLKKDGHFTDDQVRQLVLMPTDRAIDPQVTANPSAPLAPYDAAFASMKPSDFYQRGVATPFETKTGPGGDGDELEGELRSNRIHIVIVPGIFGEFIPVSPFEEVFRAGGSAKTAFEQKLHALEVEVDGDAGADPAKKALTRDRQYAATAVKDIDRSMRDLVRVGSIDDPRDGKPLVTITYLKPEVGSLETFGTLDENADYYLSRLDKYFKINGGVPEHLYVMGYSRGTATALNLVSRAQAAHAAWMPNLKGVIALAGVYGSQLADVALSAGPQKELLDTTVDFVENQLESCQGETPLARSQNTPQTFLMTRNLGHWTAFAARAGLQATRLGNRNADLAREGIETNMADVGRFVSFTQRVLFGDPKNVFGSDSTDTSAISGILHMNAASSEYCSNIERFKVTAKQIVKGVQTLTTASRLEWWKRHTLPSNVRYFAITGTMGDATPANARPSPLTLNSTAYDTHSVDFRSLRGNYYDLYAASNNQLQDSQVPVPRGRFWPEIHGSLNPQQGALKTYFMGTLGIHHWGLSFPRAFSTRDGLEANPFPRTILLKSIGTFVAQVERTNG